MYKSLLFSGLVLYLCSYRVSKTFNLDTYSSHRKQASEHMHIHRKSQVGAMHG